VTVALIAVVMIESSPAALNDKLIWTDEILHAPEVWSPFAGWTSGNPAGRAHMPHSLFQECMPPDAPGARLEIVFSAASVF